MLGRTAGSIFWMYRYLERAENIARLLEAGARMALMRGAGAAGDEWRSVLLTLGQQRYYDMVHDEYTGMQVINFVLRGKDNPESVLGMIEVARNNARASRTSITTEVWEAANECWMAIKDLLKRPVGEANLAEVLYAIRRDATLVRGATYGSMYRDEIYHFARAGTFLERADNTARILDVKYHLLLPSYSHVGSSMDTSQWDNILRSLSARRAHRTLNPGHGDARNIAELLILDPGFPRSMSFCYDALSANLASLTSLHGMESQSDRLMQEAERWMTDSTIDTIFDTGLHEVLITFIANNQAIAQAISNDYRFVD
jgi:uncharacterized alpha-E superfamily protein